MVINNNNITLGILSATSADPRIAQLLSENDTLSRFVPVPKDQLSHEQIVSILFEEGFSSMKDGMTFFKNNYEGQYNPKELSNTLKLAFNK